MSPPQLGYNRGGAAFPLWIPKVIDAGVEYAVAVHRDKVTSKMGMESSQDQIDDSRPGYVLMVTGVTGSVEEARGWIASQRGYSQNQIIPVAIGGPTHPPCRSVCARLVTHVPTSTHLCTLKWDEEIETVVFTWNEFATGQRLREGPATC